MAAPLAIRIDPARPDDFGSRRNTPIDTIVIHTTEGSSIAGAETWWDREDVVASAHYVIDGQVISARVPENDAAFHAGNRTVNRRSIGIEVVGHCGERGMWTPAVMRQLVQLCAEIAQRHRIPLVHQVGPGICGHADVPDPTNPNLRGGLGHHHDPGPFFDFGAFLDALRAELAGGTPAQEIA